jgi:predicted O-linked N-acetylglucosamine transferase (SPINDLY family)
VHCGSSARGRLEFYPDSQIYNDGIDILVDLSGHTSKNRLAVFAWKAAPVQVSWLGFFASTGVPGIDFLLTDSISVPEDDCIIYF